MEVFSAFFDKLAQKIITLCLCCPHAGAQYIIYNCKECDWRNHTFPSKQERDYQQKMLKKEQRLLESGQHFLFLFKSEMFNNHYRNILENKINEIRREAA